MLRLVRATRPRGVMIENVRGLLGRRFDDYRARIIKEFKSLGYRAEWNLLNACDFGVPQLRPRSVLVALDESDYGFWTWPEGDRDSTPSVGEVLLPSMTSNGWKGAKTWARSANDIAPTLVGGSKKHGGADLGPTRERLAWAALGVNGVALADNVPDRHFKGTPKITVAQAALIQGFPPDWQFQGRKTASYRQVGNAFPPPVAEAVGRSIAVAWSKADRTQQRAESLRSELEALPKAV
jgi:DNA (cytosine-5)-methyltransferase 1